MKVLLKVWLILENLLAQFTMKKITLVGLFLLGGSFLFAQAEKPVHEIHAQMISNFIKYILWPNDSEPGDLVVGVLGEDDVFNTMKHFNDGKPIRAKKYAIKKLASAEEAATCQVVYVGKDKSDQFESVKSSIEGKAVLTITDSFNLGKKGSCINFIVLEGRLKFEINQASVSASTLKVAGQLSSMAILL
jgi:hypothetical protein